MIIHDDDIFYEKLRIPYIFNEEHHTYIVDFIDEKNKIVYEIKPNTLLEKKVNKIKEKTLIKWCENNGFKYIHIDEKDLSTINFDDFLNILKTKNFYIEDDSIITKIQKFYANYKNKIN